MRHGSLNSLFHVASYLTSNVDNLDWEVGHGVVLLVDVELREDRLEQHDGDLPITGHEP